MSTAADIQVPAVALRADDAARALGVSRDWFDANVAREVPHIRRGRMVLYSVRALERWVEANVERA